MDIKLKLIELEIIRCLYNSNSKITEAEEIVIKLQKNIDEILFAIKNLEQHKLIEKKTYKTQSGIKLPSYCLSPENVARTINETCIMPDCKKKSLAEKLDLLITKNNGENSKSNKDIRYEKIEELGKLPKNLLRAIINNPGNSANELAERFSNKNSTLNALSRLKKEKLVRRTGGGKRSSPYKYYLFQGADMKIIKATIPLVEFESTLLSDTLKTYVEKLSKTEDELNEIDRQIEALIENKNPLYLKQKQIKEAMQKVLS